jgi:hypothetical protein
LGVITPSRKLSNNLGGAAKKFKLSLGGAPKLPKEIMVGTVYEAAEEMENSNVYFKPILQEQLLSCKGIGKNNYFKKLGSRAFETPKGVGGQIMSFPSFPQNNGRMYT